MVFSSNIFLFAFLPAFLAVYYAVPFRHRSLVITIGSYIFYGWWRVDFLALLFLVTLWNYCVGLAIDRADGDRRRHLLVLGVAVNLGALAYFKYFNFLVASLNDVLAMAGQGTLDAWHVLLPIGISFFVFQSISYLVDVYRRDVEPARKFADLAAFKSLFPQLIAGPVLRYKDLEWQFRYREHSWAKFGEGVYRFAQGFAMKVLIADSVAPTVAMAFDQPAPSFAEAWLGALAYTAQLYFDFAGYSAMAIGLGLMMGFRFIENFNQPYVSHSITEFWRRWHISLSTWLRDYLYIPLGGNRGGEAKTYRNLLLTMVLGGLWHGANWTFVLWGAWHGGWMAVERFVQSRRGGRTASDTRLFGWLSWPLTFLLVILGWVMFRAPDVATAGRFYGAMLGANGFDLGDHMAWQVRMGDLAMLALAYGIIVWRGLGLTLPWQRGMPVQVAGGAAPAATATTVVTPHVAAAIVSLMLLVLAVTKLSASSFSPFLYFQF
ncbi:MAG TPA: MBOAT family protein [Alphaproteobacteria bacterium]|nr:MBOAT family protein [Alphaproteobacteria bacterium]